MSGTPSYSAKDVKGLDVDVKIDNNKNDDATPKLIKILCCGEPLEFDINDSSTMRLLKRFEFIDAIITGGDMCVTIMEMTKTEFQSFLKIMQSNPVITKDLLHKKEIASKFHDVNLDLFCDRYAIDTSRLVDFVMEANQVDVVPVLKKLLNQALELATEHKFEKFKHPNFCGERIPAKYFYKYRISAIKPPEIKNLIESKGIDLGIKKLTDSIPDKSVYIEWRKSNIVFFIFNPKYSLQELSEIIIRSIK